MPDLPITWVEVFAEAPLEGNLLPVLHDAGATSDAVLAVVARRFLQPETSFLQPAADAASTYRHRIFTIAGEIPFAGHPSLGAAAAHAFRSRATGVDYVQETPSGRQRLHVELDGALGLVSLRQNPATFDPPVEATSVLSALGIAAGERTPDLEAQVVSTGLPALILPVRSARTVSSAVFDRDRLRAALQPFSDPESLNCYLVAERGPGHWRARSFAVDLATGEDPATGSAAGPLGAYLSRHRGISRIVVEQGVEMGSPSRLHVDASAGIEVSGKVRITGTGTHHVPADWPAR